MQKELKIFKLRRRKLKESSWKKIATKKDRKDRPTKVLNGYKEEWEWQQQNMEKSAAQTRWPWQRPWRPVTCLLWLPLSKGESVSDTPLRIKHCLNTAPEKTLSRGKTFTYNEDMQTYQSLLKISHLHPFVKFLRVIWHLLRHRDQWNKCSPLLQTFAHVTPYLPLHPPSSPPCCQHAHARAFYTA